MKKITKINTSSDPIVDSASSVAEYRNSDALSPNVGYWILGNITRGPEIGEHMVVDRSVRNGVSCPGIFMTSKITAIAEGDDVTYVYTDNSIYMIED